MELPRSLATFLVLWKITAPDSQMTNWGGVDPVLNKVTFTIEEGAQVTADGETIADQGTAMAKDGTIVFSAYAKEGYEITSVLVDGEKEARNTADSSTEYIIEGIKTDETVVSVSTQPAADDGVRRNVVTFEVAEGASVTVDGVDATNSTAMAKDGTIVFFASPKDGYEVTSVIFDGDHETRKTSDESGNEYIIEGIQTDETVISVSTRALETEAAETETEAIKKEIKFNAEDGVIVTVNGRDVTNKTVKTEAETIEFQVETEEGYEVEQVVAEADGEEAEVAENGNGEYTVMELAADNETVVNVMAASTEIAPISISGSNEVKVSETIKLTSNAKNAKNHSWTSNDKKSSIAKVSGSGGTATVTGVAPGTVTITHTYTTTDYWGNQQTHTETHEVTVVAAGQCTVTFNRNNGSGNAPESQSVKRGGTITLPGQGNMTARNGYVFVGWSTNAGAATERGNVNKPENTAVYPAGSQYTVDGNITLYAIWAQQNVTATFYIRLDGTMPKEPASYGLGQYTSGITINGVLKEGYFYFNPQGVDDKLNSMPSEDQIKSQVDAQITGKTYVIGTDYIVWYVIKHEYNGWHVDGVLYTKEKVRLTYDENVPAGYSSYVQGIPMGRQYVKDTEVTVEGTPRWPGHTFQGWALNKEGPVVYHAGDQFMITEDTVLYAIWDEITSSVTVKKQWIDGNSNTRPENIEVQLKQDGENYGDAVTLNSENSWTYVWRNLPQTDETGEKHVYTVEEIAVNGYNATYGDAQTDGNGNISITVTNTRDDIDAKIDVTGTKTWIDGGKTHNNAAEVKLTLSRTSAKTGSEAETVEATVAWDHNTYTFKDLPKYDADGYEYTYSVAEDEVPGYTSEKVGDYGFKNTIVQDSTVSVSGTKTWIDPKGSKHPEVTIQLLRDGKAYKTTKLENDAYSFTGLDKYDLSNGHVYEYTVEELEVEGYTSVKNGTNFTNTIKQDSTVSVSGTKTWIDPEGSVHPEVTIQLLRDGESFETTTLVDDKYSFTGLDKYDLSDGHVYEYTVEELEVEGYTSVKNGTNFTNTIEQDSTVSVSGTKTWIDPEGSERPEVTIQLLRDGKPAGTTTLVDDAYSFTGLDKYDLNDGHVYEYTVKELSVPGYTSVQDGTNFTNTIEQDSTVSVSGTKTWIDPEGSEHPEVTIQLLRDGEEYKTTTLVGDAYSFTGLDKYDLSDGHVYEYTVEELSVPGYTSVQDGTNFTNTIVQDSTVSVSGTKTWIDPDGSEHPEVTIQLLRDGKPAGTTTLVDDAYSFTDLDKYDLSDGHVYEYTVEELAVPGYTSEKVGDYDFKNTIAQDNTMSVSGTKKWIAPEGSEHPEVTIQLLRDGKPAGTTKLVNDAYSFTGLDRYDLTDGHAYKYTVEELRVEGYTSEKVGDYNFINTIEQDSTVSVSGTKTWVDPEGSEHPEVMIQLLRDGKPAGTTTLVDDAYSFTGLDKYDLTDGHVYEYTVEELEVEGYTSIKNGTNFTNTIKQDSTVSVSGTKTWVDPEGSEHPEVTIQLLRDGEPAGTTTLVDDAYSFTGLDKYDLTDGHVYEYTVEELEVEGYTSVKDGTNFTNTIKQDSTVSVSGTKTWIDPKGSEHPEVMIQLLRDGEPAGTTTLVDDAYSFTGLDKYDLSDGHVYEYTVEELEVEGYTSVKNGTNFTNTIEQDSTVSVSGTKKWIDPEGNEHPEVTIQLLRDGEAYKTTTLVDDAYSFNGLDKYDLSDGHVYEYTVKELPVSGYTSAQDGTNFTNTIVQDSTVSVSGTKTWIDPDGSEHPEVTIQLLRDGEPAGTTTLVGDAYSFTGLDKYDLSDGHVYEYTVEELSVPGYTSVQDGTNFTNTIEQDSTVSVSGTKTWIDPEGSEHPEVTIQLLRDGEPAGTTTLVDDAYSFTNLDKYDLTDGHVYEYTVKELEVPGYTSVKNGTDFTNTIVQDNTVNVNGTKTWVVPEGKIVPDVTIELYRDDVKIDETVIESGSATYSFAGLPKYAVGEIEGYEGEYDGHLFTYTVKEVVPEGYTEEQDGNNFTNTMNDDDPYGSKTRETVADADMIIETLADGTKKELLKVGAEVTYTISYYNHTNKAADVKITDTLPAGTEFLNASGGGSYSDGTVTWTISNVGPFEKGSVTVTVRIKEEILNTPSKDPEVVNKASIQVGDEPATEVSSTPDYVAKPALTSEKTLTNEGSGENGAFNVGETATFDITVTNSGNTTQDVTVTEDLYGAVIVEGEGYTINEVGQAVITDMTPGATVVVKAVYTVTQEDIDSTDELKNTAIVEGEGDDTPKPETTISKEQKPGLEVTKRALGNNYMVKAGETVRYIVHVKNTGNVTLQEIRIKDSLLEIEILGREDVHESEEEDGTYYNISESLAPGEEISIIYEYVVTQDDVDRGFVDNTVIARATNPLYPNVPLEDSDSVTRTAEQNPGLKIEKAVTSEAPEGGYGVGDEVTYTLTVTNTGNVTLSDVTVTDKLAGAEITEGEGYTLNEDGTATISETMGPDKEVTLNVTYTVTQADVNAQSFENIASVIGTAPDGTEAGDEDRVITYTEPSHAGIEIAKEETSTAPEGGYGVGDEVTYTLTVTNTGNVTLKDVTVTDSLEGAEIAESDSYILNADGTATIEALDPGEANAVTLNVTYTVTQTDVDAGQIENTAIAENGAVGDSASVTVGTEERNPGLEVDKTIKGNSNYAEKVGDTITYRIHVKNTGNVTLHNIIVADSLGSEWAKDSSTSGGNVWIETLMPNEEKVFEYEHVVTQADMDAGSIINTATATAENPVNPEEPLKDSDSVVAGTEQKPGLAALKSLTNKGSGENGAFKAGETAEFDIVIRNSGNTTQKNVAVAEALEGAVVVEGEGYTINDAGQAVIAEMAPGALVTVKAAYTVTQEDIDSAEELKNVAVVDGEGDIPDPEIPIPKEERKPGLEVTKGLLGSDYAVKAGETVRYIVHVKNTGNVTLTDIVVVDGLEEAQLAEGMDAYKSEDGTICVKSLAPGKEAGIIFEYVVTQADVDAGSITNTATATAKNPVNPDEELNSSDSVTRDVEQYPKLATTKTLTNSGSGKDGAFKAGETAKFDIVVKNTGNTTQHDVVITETMTGAKIVDGNGYEVSADGTAIIPTIEVGKSVTVKAEYTVTQTDIDDQTELANTVTVNGGGNTPNPDPAEIPTEERDPHLTVTKTTTSKPKNGETYALGETITYEITATNDGNVTLTDITVTDELTGDEWTVASLAPGESKNFTAKYVVIEADILAGSVLNVAMAKGTSPDPDEPEVPVTPGEDEEPTDLGAPKLEVTKTITGGKNDGYALGDTVTFHITVTNTGNLTLTDVTVTDELTDDSWTIGNLAPGEKSETFTAEYKVTEEDILAGRIVNQAEAKGTDPNGKEVSARDAVLAIPVKPNGHLTITKTTTSKPANGETYALGETITYEITATNDGNLTLTDVVVTDELTKNEWTVYTFEPGDVRTFAASHVVTEADIRRGSVKNIATGKGASPDPDTPPTVVPGETEDPTQAAAPSLYVDKTAEPKEGGYALGETVTYTIKVTNNGNVTVANIKVTDDLTGDEWTIGSLEPNESDEHEVTYTVTEDDILAGKIENTAAAAGIDPNGNDVTDDDDETVTTAPKNGHLTVTKTTTSEPENGETYALGETITYSITATNDGNLTLTNVVVTDELIGDEWTVASLAPGETSAVFTAEHVVTEEDILAGSVLNVATAEGTSPDPDELDVPVTPGEDEETTDLGVPKLEVSKTIAGGKNDGYALGDTVTFHITVTNTGNLTLTDVAVTDELTGDSWTIDSLAPGEKSETFTAEYKVTEEDILAGRIVNQAEAKGTDPNGKEVSARDAVLAIPVKPNGHLTIMKTTASKPENGETYALGETITYEITATNDGNLTLTDVVVTDELTGDSWTIGSLAPNTSATFTTSYVVKEADLGEDNKPGSVVNTAKATGTSPDPNKPDVPVNPGETEDPTDPKAPGLTAVKAVTNAPEGGFKAGDIANFDITVTNSGNTTQTNVVVSEQLAGAKVVPGTGYAINEAGQAVIEKMAPKAVVVVKAIYQVTQADIDSNAELKNIALADGDTGTDPDPTPEIPIPEEGQIKSLSAVKSVTNMPKSGFFKAGETAEFAITVTNTGNTTQKNVVVTEKLAGAAIVEAEADENGVKAYRVEDGQAVIAEMAPGATVVVKAAYTVTQEDIDSDAKLRNIAAVGGGDPTDPVPDPEVEIPKEPKKPGLAAVKTVTNTPEGGFKAGETAEFDITVTNTGNTTQTDVVVTEQLAGAEIEEGTGYTINEDGQAVIGTMKPNDTVTVRAKYTVTQEDIDSDAELKNIAKVGPEDGPDPEVVIPEEPKNPGLTAVKTLTNAGSGTDKDGNSNGSFKAGETAAFDITVTNSGNTTQTNVVVSEQLAGAEIAEGEGYTIRDGKAVIAEMEPDTVVIVKATYTVTQEDIDSNAELKNIALVEGDNGINPDPTPEIPVPEDEKKPGLTATKTLTNAGTGANGAFKAGETATFDITVENTGNTTQTNVTVEEQLAGAAIVEAEADENGVKAYKVESGKAVIEEMKPGATVVVKATYTVTQADIDSDAKLKNIATVNGDNPGPDPETEIPEENQSKSLSAFKTVTNLPESGFFRAGETAEFDITVTNTGNTTQKNVTVTEQLAGAAIVEAESDENGVKAYKVENGQAVIAEMKPGAVVVVKATYQVTQADIDNKAKLVNIAAVGGGDPTNPVPDPKVEIPKEPGEPGLAAVKTVTNAPEGGFKAGETAEFAITVTNTGNTTQTDVIVEEQLEGAKIVKGEGYTINEDGQAVIAEMAPKAVVTVKAEYTVTQEDIDSDAELKNIAKVGPDDGPDPGVTIPEEPKNPGLTASKELMNAGTGENGKFKAGDTANFDITVKNTGNTTQTNVVVSEQLAGAEIVPGTGYAINEAGQAVIEKMAPDAEVVVKATYTVTQEDIDSDADLKNIALVEGDNGTNPDPEPEIPIPEEEKKPGLTTAKSVTNAGTGENGKFKAGDTANFDITVKNTGNTTQTNVVVSEQLAGAEIVPGTGYAINEAGQAVIEKMAPNAVVIVKATYTVTQEDIDSDAELKNVALVDGDSGTDPDPEPEIPIPEEEKKPGLTAVKAVTNAPEGGFKAGDIASFDIIVTNSGNTTQTNVVVSEQLAGAKVVPGTGYAINEAGQAVIAEMKPGAVVVVKAAYQVTQEDIDSDAELKNIALADGDTGEDPDPTPEIPIPEEGQNKSLSAVKTVTNLPESGFFKAGETANFDITVKNTGNTTQKNVVVTEKLAGAAIVEGEGYTISEADQAVIAEMAPDAEVTVKAVYTVTQEDIDSDAKLENIAAVGGGDPTDPVPNPEVEIPKEPKEPGLAAVKTLTNAPAGGFKAGETARFDITVTNTGNTTQTNVTVTEQLAGAKIVAGEGYTISEDGQAVIGTLKPNDTVTVKAEYTVTQEDIDSDAELKNIAKVGPEDGPDPGVVIPEEPKNPGLTAVKTLTNEGSGENGAFRADDTAAFDITVTNSGNTTQTDVTVEEQLAGAEIVAGEGYTIRDGRAVIEKMVPGAVVVVKAVYTVTQEDIDSDAELKNIALVKGDNGTNPDPDPEIPIPEEEKKPGLRTAKSVTNVGTGENGKFKAGDTATFDITVENTGNTTQTDVTVTEQLAGAEIVAGEGYTINRDGQAVIAEMAPGAVAVVKAAYTVTQADIDSSTELKNIASVNGENPGPDPQIPIPEENQNKSLTAVKTVTNAPAEGFKAGETAEFAITVTNTGNTTQTNVTVTEQLADAEIVEGEGYTINEDGQAVIAEMAPGAVVVVKAAYTVTQEDIDSDEKLENIAVIGGGDPTEPVPDPEVEIPVEPKEPNLSAIKTVTNAPEGGFKAGETAEFAITVTNTGNTTQTDVTVTEQLAGAKIMEGEGYTISEDGQAVIGTLRPNDTVTVKAEYTVTQEDIDSDAELKNIVHVGPENGPDPGVVIPEEPKHPGLTAAKTLTNAGSGENGAFKAGETAEFDITVTNTGNTTQTGVTVTEQLAGAEIVEGEGYTISDGKAVIAEMEPGAAVVVKAAYKVTQADIDSNTELKNIALAEGDNGTNPDPDPEIPIPTEPKDGHVTITKTTTSTPANGTAYVLGETITYEITAKNDGNLTVTDVVVTDELTGDEWTIESLAPNASETFTAEHVVTEADILAGSVVNVATAKGTNPDPEEPEVPVTPGEKEDPTEPKSGHVTITKTTTSTPANGETYVLGETITYEITAKNDGNLTVTDVVVTDELTGDEWTIESLAPNASETFTAEHVVTEADILAGSVVNVATAKGTSPDPDEPEVPTEPGEKEDPTQTAAPSLFVEKTAEPKEGGYALGEAITYTIKVTNNGNVTIRDIKVTDELTGDEWTIESLEPNTSNEQEVTYTVTEADIFAGEIRNTATAAGTDPNGAEVTDDDDATVRTEPKNGHVTIAKTTTSTPANGTAYALGEAITYSITAANDGNMTVTNVTVTDELTGDAWTIDSLAPGASQTFTAAYTVTEADISAGRVLNVATAAGTSPDPDVPEVPVTPGEKEDPTEERRPELSVEKTVTSAPAAADGKYVVGETITYQVTVTNTGNLTVQNVTVQDVITRPNGAQVIPDGLVQGLAPIESLAPGASAVFTYSHVVTEADLGGNLINSVAVTGTPASEDPTPETPDPIPGDTDQETIVTEDPSNSSITVSKTNVDGLTNALLSLPGAQFYAAVFSDAQLTQRVGNVQAITFSGEQATASTTFTGLKRGTYYIAETDAAGNVLTSGQYNGGTFTPEYASGQQAVITENGQTAEFAFRNLFAVLPEEGYSRMAELTITKKVQDTSGAAMNSNETFYAGLFYDEACTIPAEGVSQQIVPIAMNGGSSASAAAEVTILNDGSDTVLYVTEVTADGTPVSSVDDFAYEASVDGSRVAVNMESPEAAVTITNTADGMQPGYYVAGDLTITKEVRDAEGSQSNSDETFYAGIFSDAAYTTLADNVSQPIVALNMQGAFQTSASVEVTVPNDGSDTRLYVTEVTKDGTPVAGSGSFAYDVTVEGGTVVMSSSVLEDSVKIINTVKSPDESETEESETEEPGTDDDERDQNTSESETDRTQNMESVRTGDETPVMMWTVLFLAAALAMFLAAVSCFRRRRSR